MVACVIGVFFLSVNRLLFSGGGPIITTDLWPLFSGPGWPFHPGPNNGVGFSDIDLECRPLFALIQIHIHMIRGLTHRADRHGEKWVNALVKKY